MRDWVWFVVATIAVAAAAAGGCLVGWYAVVALRSL